MAQFKFRLHTMLTLALARRDRCRIELAETVARAREVERQIAALDEELRTISAGRAGRPGPLDVGRLLSQDRYGATLRENRAQCLHQLTVLSAEIDSRRELLLTADREVRMLETLRDKQRAQFTADERGREQRALDEIGARGGPRQAEA